MRTGTARILAAVIVILLGSFRSEANAAGLSLIRDAEIEQTLRDYATPLFRAAGVAPSSVRIILVKDDSLNAFVAGGMNLFLHTGLLIRSENAGQVIGVIAHETGHISGGHLARMREELRGAQFKNVIGVLIGIAAAIAAKSPELGSSIWQGGQHVATRDFLTYSRTQESAADQAALTFLDRTRLSAKGLMEFMSILSGQELLMPGNQDPYVRTHPLAPERVNAIRAHVKRSPYSDRALPPEWVESHKRMVAKLVAFLESPMRALRRYPISDTSIAARYARAIAHYRIPNLDRALGLIDALIREEPNNPYFHELKGQMLFEHGQVRESLPSYRKAVSLVPNSGLIRLALGHALVEAGDPKLAREAVMVLERGLEEEPQSAHGWKVLGTAYHRLGETGKAWIAFAESAAKRGDQEQARALANRALEQLPTGSPFWLQAQDLVNELDRRRD